MKARRVFLLTPNKIILNKATGRSEGTSISALEILLQKNQINFILTVKNIIFRRVKGTNYRRLIENVQELFIDPRELLFSGHK